MRGPLAAMAARRVGVGSWGCQSAGQQAPAPAGGWPRAGSDGEWRRPAARQLARGSCRMRRHTLKFNFKEWQ